MNHRESPVFALANFEGPLDFLWHLIQKSEIDICEINLQQITDQYSLSGLDQGAEFVGTTASLLLLKSRSLLPQHEQSISPENEELDPRFEIIHQLLDYCRFKDTARLLMEREKKQSSFYVRGVDGTHEVQKPLGIDHLTLEDLASLFQTIVSKAESKTGFIDEDIWRVSDKIFWLREELKIHRSTFFSALFSEELCREELIVTFLAVLELMKLGELTVIREKTTQEIMIVGVANG